MAASTGHIGRAAGADLLKADNKLEELKRRPSDLRRYLRWSFDTKLSYGSITNFVVQERLHWTPRHHMTAEKPLNSHSFAHRSSIPFEDPADYQILVNDWPYGFASGITHLLVWSRTPIAVDAEQGDVTIESRQQIERCVRDFFVKPIAEFEHISDADAAARVVWFKNWVSLQSVRGVDHIHVLLKEVDALCIKQLTHSG